jgi:hypothetical protein
MDWADGSHVSCCLFESFDEGLSNHPESENSKRELFIHKLKKGEHEKKNRK